MRPIRLITAEGWTAFDPEEIRSIDYDKDSGYLRVWLKPPIPDKGLTSWGVNCVSEDKAREIWRDWYSAKSGD